MLFRVCGFEGVADKPILDPAAMGRPEALGKTGVRDLFDLSEGIPETEEGDKAVLVGALRPASAATGPLSDVVLATCRRLGSLLRLILGGAGEGDVRLPRDRKGALVFAATVADANGECVSAARRDGGAKSRADVRA
jgi:hypothetical protein